MQTVRAKNRVADFEAGYLFADSLNVAVTVVARMRIRISLIHIVSIQLLS
jgi:hypothetical protein